MEPVRKRAVRERSAGDEPEEVRGWIARGFTHVEDIVYVGLGVLLAGIALVLLVDGALQFVRLFTAGDRLQPSVVELLDRILLILMIVEVMYTVQVSFREHALVPEPFLLVALIAATRRILVLTAEFAELADKGPDVFRNAMVELGILTAMILVLVASLLVLRRRPVQAERA
jgi:phosphate starvation-inducible membrane PsiE